jgi:hypothetical protein
MEFKTLFVCHGPATTREGSTPHASLWERSSSSNRRCSTVTRSKRRAPTVGSKLSSESLEQLLPWVVLILGGIITVGFTYLFGLENTLVHTLMVAALALIISISLFTVAALDHPFSGDTRIHPAAFEQVLERFHESNLSDLRG